MQFVLTALNYAELADFIKLAAAAAALVNVSGFSARTAEEAAELAIHLPGHKDYEKLKNLLKDPVFALPHVYLFPDIEKVRAEALAGG